MNFWWWLLVGDVAMFLVWLLAYSRGRLNAMFGIVVCYLSLLVWGVLLVLDVVAVLTWWVLKAYRA